MVTVESDGNIRHRLMMRESMDGSHYEALQVARDCSADELRRAYHRAARQHHPDKQNAGVAEQNDAVQAVNDCEFVRIQTAYEVLRDPETRAAYDRQSAQEALRQQRDVEDVRIADEVPLGQMQHEVIAGDDGEEDEVLYSHQCRCGDVYEISADEIEDGVDIVPCNGCSLNIRVLVEKERDDKAAWE